jgi:multiple sugar transport system permease protein
MIVNSGAKASIERTVVLAALVLVALAFFSPFIWQLSTSLKDPTQILARPRAFFPLPLHLENYVIIFQKFPILRFLRNTAIVVASCIAVNLAVSSLAGYALARLKFHGRETVFMLTISCMFMPLFLTIIPRFILFIKLGVIETLLPLIIPSLGSPFCIFLLRQFFRMVPEELSHAARIDGCGEFQIYSRIVLPLSRSALITVVIFTAQWRWNEFLEPLIYLRSEKLYTITLGLYQIMGLSAEETTTHLVMATVGVSLAPIIVLFIVAQRYFVEGLAHTGLKG